MMTTKIDPQDHVRVGVLGLGQRGLQHLKALWQLQQEGLVQVVALCDAFPNNLEEAKVQTYVPGFQQQTILCTTSFETLLEANLDALYICLPPNVHSGEVIRAAQAGIHLFVEKPMSLYLDEAIEMEQAIVEAGVISCVGFQQRFDVQHEAIYHFLQGNASTDQSKPRLDRRPVMAIYSMHAPFEAHNVKHTHTEKKGGPSNRVWTASAAWSGMTVVEGGIHPLDLWRYWFGDVVWVQATYVHRPPEEVFDGADNPYAYSVLFGFASGAVGTMTLSRLRRTFSTHSEHHLLWHEGRLALEGSAVAVYHYAGDYPPTSQPSAAEVRSTLELSKAVDSTLEIARAFVTAIADNNPGLIRSSFTDAMNSLTAVLAANVSDALDGRRVHVNDLLIADEYAKFRQRV